MTCSFCKAANPTLVLEDVQHAAGICRDCLAELAMLASWETRNRLRRRPVVDGELEQSTMIALQRWIVEAKKREATRYVRFLERGQIPPSARAGLTCTFCGALRSACAKLYASLVDHVFICDRCARDPRDRGDDNPVEAPVSCSFCLEVRPSYAIDGADVRICDDCIGLALDIVAQELEIAGDDPVPATSRDAPASAEEQVQARSRANSPAYRCTFCGAHRADRRKLISGLTENVFICDRCAREARDPK